MSNEWGFVFLNAAIIIFNLIFLSILSISGLLIVIRKPIRNEWRGTLKHEWTLIVMRQPIRNEWHGTLKHEWTLIVMRQPIRNEWHGTLKHEWTLIVCKWPNKKKYLSACGNTWNPKIAFHNRTTCLLRYECFSRDYDLFFLVERWELPFLDKVRIKVRLLKLWCSLKMMWILRVCW